MPDCDIVLSGGGVRGIAHIGAIAALERADYNIRRAAGASAGAIAGALAVAGVPSERMQSLLDEMDVRSFAFSDVLQGIRGVLGMRGLIERLGLDGPGAIDFLEDVLSQHGVETWADLADEESTHPDPARRYRLIVRCLDVANRRIVRFPWDYPSYGLDPDEQSVAQAIRASMSVPFVYKAVTLPSQVPDMADPVLVDGGMGSGTPVSIFDRLDGTPRWPTFAVRVDPNPHDDPPDLETTVGMLKALVETLLEAADPLEHALPRDIARTVTVDALGIRTLDVRKLADVQTRLVESGHRAMATFLETFDFETYLREHGGGSAHMLDPVLAEKADVLNIRDRTGRVERSAPTPDGLGPT